ncbi:MAG TPA: lamin tail domain-containing protein [Frankiaceae bacterium]|nr:lamin tail domain-containing protein [Frankiaceae bacterium]
MRRTCALLASLTVAGATALGAAPAEAASALQFGRINYNSPGSDTSANTSVNGEWVVVKNVSSSTRCLTGWTVRDVAGHVYKFGSFCLGGYKTVALHSGKGTNSSTRRYWGSGWHIWNNTGDTAALRNSSGTLMDSCRWSSNGAGYTNC